MVKTINTFSIQIGFAMLSCHSVSFGKELVVLKAIRYKIMLIYVAKRLFF